MSTEEYSAFMVGYMCANPPTKKDKKVKGDPAKPQPKGTISTPRKQWDFKDKNGNVGFRVF